MSNRKTDLLNKKSVEAPRSPTTNPSKPLVVSMSQRAFRNQLRTEQQKQEPPQKPTQLMIEADGLGPILSNGSNIVTASGQTLRANRFQPVQHKEVTGTSVRYMVPITLQNKIRAHLAALLTPISQYGRPN